MSDDLIPIDHTSVTVLGYKWRANAPWAGLDFKRAKLREQSGLSVPWCHPNDQPDGWKDDCWYRVRPRNKRHRFVKMRGQWWLTA